MMMMMILIYTNTTIITNIYPIFSLRLFSNIIITFDLPKWLAHKRLGLLISLYDESKSRKLTATVANQKLRKDSRENFL